MTDAAGSVAGPWAAGATEALIGYPEKMVAGAVASVVDLPGTIGGVSNNISGYVSTTSNLYQTQGLATATSYAVSSPWGGLNYVQAYYGCDINGNPVDAIQQISTGCLKTASVASLGASVVPPFYATPGDQRAVTPASFYNVADTGIDLTAYGSRSVCGRWRHPPPFVSVPPTPVGRPPRRISAGETSGAMRRSAQMWR